jgi:pyruvate, water dikinase
VEFRGISASTGRYTGPVAVVITHLDVPRVRPGDVLVSPMTDPYYMPALLRAAAIVTDEGGFTSHAAITARELGIPCIVDTKIASTALCDGMVVDVDASCPIGVVSLCQDQRGTPRR